MTASVRYISPECHGDAHEMCPGTVDIRRTGAPAWEAPIQCLRCDCTGCGHERVAER